ncbi:MAG: glutathionylspermidine synthase family protein [Candidatus Eremiobacteraeota bacterium]|nr:glutathionylspermidine synthase family protein [Candidatus Eremiobacteraeota bacterium]
MDGREYGVFDVHPIEPAHLAELRAAATDAWHIMMRVAPVLRALPDEELRIIGIPAAALRACRLHDPVLGESLVARFDFAWTDRGFKVLELNAETPFFLWESHEIAGATARAFGFGDPNATSLAALRAAIARAAGPSGGSRLTVTAYNTWREDWFTAVFAGRVASEAIGRHVDVVPLHELRVSRGVLRAAGKRIDVLWRFYPLEHFASDLAGPELFELLEAGALRLINPPSALLLQNKAALAIVWDLAERGVWFDAEERATIARLFLPTFLDPPPGNEPYVRKPVLGREGNSVTIVRGAATLAASAARDYGAQPAVYQRFVALPDICGGKAIATCFVTDGVAGAVALRVGGLITDGRARFVPLGLRRRP